MKHLYVLLYTLFVVAHLQAQQPAQNSLYMLNPYGVNPAAAGLSNTMVATGGYRAQWVGIEGNPTTQYVNVSLPLSIIGSGLGISLHNESIGARNGLSAKASYNYIMKIREGSLSFGAAGGIVQGAISGNKLRTPDGVYEPNGSIDHRDKILSTIAINGITPTFDAGIYYKSEKFEGGISTTNLTEPKLTLSGQQQLTMTLKRNYFALAVVHFNMSKSISVHPSLLVKSDAIQTQIDFSTFFRYNDNIFLGASFRGYSKNTQDALAAFGGIQLNPKLMLGYSYDITMSALKSTTQGTHEIVLQYNLGKEFGKGKLPPIIYNPRF